MVGEPGRAADDCAKAEAEIAKNLESASGAEAARLAKSRGKIASRRADALARLGRLDEAVAVCAAAAEATDEDALRKKADEMGEALELQRAADEALAKKEYSRAKRCLVRLRDDKKVSDDARLRAKLAKCHFHCKEYEDGSRTGRRPSPGVQGAPLLDARRGSAARGLARERAAQARP